MTVTSRDLQVITGRAAREGARERVYFAQKPIAVTKMARHYILCLKAVRRHRRAKCLISLKATGEQAAHCSLVASPSAWWRQSNPLDPLGVMLAEQRREKSSI